jgi:glycosyltransferase involved in cell wall biosynthesis
MKNSKFSIVIPTMWKYKPFIGFLKDLVEFPLVDEVIIINNNSKETPDNEILKHDKIKLNDFGENIYVNPAWNLGVKQSRNKQVCIVNDDIIFDLRLFYRVNEVMTQYTGVLGLCPGVSPDQPQFVNGSINIIPWTGNRILGFGCLMFVHQDWWIDIPPDLNVYFGDNWIFDTCIMNGRPNYLITDLLHRTPYAVTTSDQTNKFFDNFFSEEEACYTIHKRNYANSTAIINYWFLRHQYESARDTPSDINEHIPTLFEYARKCKTITEFGVRTGVSTRAFLLSDAVLSSYDIIQDDNVRSLFNKVQEIGRNAHYYIADVLKIEIFQTDLLFIDTDHTYIQLSQELKLHGNKVNKYIILHDTVTFGAELTRAIFEFLSNNMNWRIKEHFNNNNGLTILEKML